MSNQKGFVQAILMIILLLGLGAGAYLVQRPTSLKSKASLESSRIEISGPSVSGGITTSRNVRVRLVYVPQATPNPSSNPTPSPDSEPAPPPGCYYEDVVCVTTPCPKQLVCPSATPAPSCPKPPECSGQLIHGDPQEGQCPSYFCIEPTPTPNPSSSSSGKSGVNSFSVEGTCSGGFTTVTYDCHDGYSNIESAPNGCASSEGLQEIARKACENRSSSNPYTKQTNVKGVSTAYAQAAYPTHFRIANSLAELEQATEQSFTQNNQEIDWVLTEENGSKTIYAQFKVNGTWEQSLSVNVILDQQLPPSPTPSLSPTPSSSQTPIPTRTTPQPTPTVLPTPIPSSSPTGLSLGPQCQNLFDKTQRSYRTSCGDANYDKIADINKDRTVNSLDQGQLRQHQQDESWCNDRLLNDIDPCGVTTGEQCQGLYTIMRQAYFKSCEMSNYNAMADVNKDGVVNGLDFHQIRINISNENWCSQRLADSSSPCIVDTSTQNSDINFVQQLLRNITNVLR